MADGELLVRYREPMRGDGSFPVTDDDADYWYEKTRKRLGLKGRVKLIRKEGDGEVTVRPTSGAQEGAARGPLTDLSRL